MTDEIGVMCERLGIAVDARQVALLHGFLDLLQRWNRSFNLTAVREREAMLTHHLADCLAIVPALRSRGPKRVLDVGSGGGLPGVIIATLMPGTDVTCVDDVGKKAAFVQQVAGSLGISNLHAVHSRVEKLTGAPFDLITSRAFASLADFTAVTERHLAADGVWVAMKGRTPDDEMAALPSCLEVFHVEQLSVPNMDAARCLVWIKPRRDS